MTLDKYEYTEYTVLYYNTVYSVLYGLKQYDKANNPHGT